MDLPETTPWWTQQQQQQQQIQPILMEPIPNPSIPWPPHHQHPPTWFNSHTTSSFLHYPTTTTRYLNNQNDNEVEDNDDDDDENNYNVDDATTSQQGVQEDKEHMFEKPLTPSDVGKLNRLVIPKQHAEKYFPLGASGADSGECKGLLLSFEDESGKCWRFRYSYWNSSQSYVLTKGWSRYVKDKRLDAGDVVLFERHRDDAQRLFIGWRRRRPNGSSVPAHVSRVGHGKSSGGGGDHGNEVGGVSVRWTRGYYPALPYPTHHQPLPYQHECHHAGIYINLFSNIVSYMSHGTHLHLHS